MTENDCNPAARQAGYPVGEEHDPDPSALEQGIGRDLTCQPYPGATGAWRTLWTARLPLLPLPHPLLHEDQRKPFVRPERPLIWWAILGSNQ